MSWYRCREEYDVDPHLERAPAAAEGTAHSTEHDVVFAELGGLAACAAADVDGLDGLVTVADPDGRVLASWGSRRMRHLAADSNLARSEEHTSELQSRQYLVCRLLLEKKKKS